MLYEISGQTQSANPMLVLGMTTENILTLHKMDGHEHFITYCE